MNAVFIDFSVERESGNIQNTPPTTGFSEL